MSDPRTPAATGFDLAADLPAAPSTMLLEASAGTGKTWTIAALVVRMVAEGACRLDDMLVITFTRSATRELRDRVRVGLTRAVRALDDALAGQPAPPAGRDADLDLLLDCDETELGARRRRLRQALASFDAATIATIHEFCQQVLRELGVAGTADTDAVLLEDLGDLWRESVDDLYVRGFVADEDPDFDHATAWSIARAALDDPWSHLAPDPATAPEPAARRVRFAQLTRREVDARKERLGVLGFDDLLRHVADAVQGERADHADGDTTAPEPTPAAERMRQRWSVVLVDEFQDTDPTQWRLLRQAFAGHALLVLIGDPKQSIYAFRGGNVVTYQQATGTADLHRTLDRNHRSDAALVQALQALLGGTAMGEQITVTPVRAARAGTRLHDSAGRPLTPVRLRVLTQDLPTGRKGPPIAGIRDRVADDLATLVQEQLTSGLTRDGAPLRPGDVAVLAHAHSDLATIQGRLRDAGVPAVIAGGGTVFHTRAAQEWVTLLEALLHPFHDGWVRAAALTPFLGHLPEELGDADAETLTESVRHRLLTWSDLAHGSGVAAVLEGARLHGLETRLLRHTGGERELTDLAHLGTLLHQAQQRDRMHLPGVLTWLRARVREDPREGVTPRTRRLDSDAAAVQLVTIHASKGLQFPIVYLPSLANRWIPTTIDHPRYHGDPPARDRVLDVGGPRGRSREAVIRHQQEEAQESLRLLYVAMTRAESQVVTWWFPNESNTPPSALHRVLFGRGPGEPDVPDKRALPDPQVLRSTLERWTEVGALTWEHAGTPGAPQPTHLTEAVSQRLRARVFDRTIDAGWRRLSYSRLSAPLQDAGHGTGVVSEPEVLPREDEPDDVAPEVRAAAVSSPETPVSPWAALPVGATFGSLVHDVLEHADPRSPDLEQEVRSRVDDAMVRWPVELDAETLVSALLATMRSPLGPSAPGVSLADIPLTDRLAELEFELPLSGGDRPRPPAEGADDAAPEVVLGDLADLLRRHLPEGDPLLPYAQTLADVPQLAQQPLRGYLTGSVDVVLRVGGRYLVVDYKTNWLGPRRGSDPGHPDLLLTDYAPGPLAAAMGHSDYPLQALLYAVVLHRYLRWRLPGYDPRQHLGGVLYLYVRGMGGPGTPVVDGHPCGVFTWVPPVPLVQQLSDLLDGGRPDEAGSGR